MLENGRLPRWSEQELDVDVRIVAAQPRSDQAVTQGLLGCSIAGGVSLPLPPLRA